MFPSGSGGREVFGDASLSTKRPLLFWMMAGRETGVLAVWSKCAVAEVSVGPVCAVRWMGIVEDQRGGDSVARLLGNRDAGNPDARHFADGHLEQ